MTKFSPESITLKAFKAFCFIFMLSLSSISVFAQSQSSLAPENQTEQSVSNQASSSTQSGATAQNWNWNSQGYEQNQKAPSTFGLFVKMVFMLAVVLALAYFVLRFLKKGTRIGSSDDPFLRHVSHLPLSASRSVDVVTILNHAYILGVSDNSVNLIGQLDDEELVNSMNLYADKNDNTKRPRSFDDVLSIFMPNTQRNGKKENVYGSSAWNASESLRRQRERFNENGEE